MLLWNLSAPYTNKLLKHPQHVGQVPAYCHLHLSDLLEDRFVCEIFESQVYLRLWNCEILASLCLRYEVDPSYKGPIISYVDT